MKNNLTRMRSLILKYICVWCGLVLSTIPILSVGEEIPGTGLSVFFESANVSAQGRRLSLLKVPVVNNDGSTFYVNAEFVFTLDENGQLTFDRIGTLGLVNPTNIFNFVSGTYTGTDRTTYAVGISGDSDRPAGSLNSITAYTVSASWIGGPVEGHPMLNGVTNKEEVSFPEGYAYGRWGAEHLKNYDFDSNDGWKRGYLIGVQQTGTNLSFFLF